MRDPARYQRQGATCRYFEALQPANQENTTQLGLLMNEELRKMVARLRRQQPTHPNVRLEYSNALARINLSDPKDISLFGCMAPVGPRPRCCGKDSVQRHRPEFGLCWGHSSAMNLRAVDSSVARLHSCKKPAAFSAATLAPGRSPHAARTSASVNTALARSY